jgi:hypothetical protein
MSQEEEQTSSKNIARNLGLSTRGLVTMPKYTLELSKIYKNKTKGTRPKIYRLSTNTTSPPNGSYDGAYLESSQVDVVVG